MIADPGLRQFVIPRWVMWLVKEDEAQINKWGYQTHSFPEWCSILGEEVGELNAAVLRHIFYEDSPESIFREAVQVATLAIKIAVMAHSLIPKNPVQERKTHD